MGQDAWADLTGFPATSSTWERATGRAPAELYSLVAKFGGAPNRTHGEERGASAVTTPYVLSRGAVALA